MPKKIIKKIKEKTIKVIAQEEYSKLVQEERKLGAEYNEINEAINMQLWDVRHNGQLLNEDSIKSDLLYKLKLKQNLEYKLVLHRHKRQTVYANNYKIYENEDDSSLIEAMRGIIAYSSEYNNYNENSFKERYRKLLIKEEIKTVRSGNGIWNKYMNPDPTIS